MHSTYSQTPFAVPTREELDKRVELPEVQLPPNAESYEYEFQVFEETERLIMAAYDAKLAALRAEAALIRSLIPVGENDDAFQHEFVLNKRALEAWGRQQSNLAAQRLYRTIKAKGYTGEVSPYLMEDKP